MLLIEKDITNIKLLNRKRHYKSNSAQMFAFVEHMKLIAGREMRDNDLGTLSSVYETGGKGTITVSSGVGDPGGVSYGAYQLTSKPNGGNVKRFINSAEFKWKSSFENLTPGSAEYTTKWKSLVNLHGQNFTDIEHNYIKKTHFDIQIKKVKDKLNVDLRFHSHTLNDVIWSTSVQHGGRTSVVINAINSISDPCDETKYYDKKLIEAIYAERGKTNANGNLMRFPRVTSTSVISGLKKRFKNEKKEALKRLKNETDY